ncbi:DUF1998 domain-containing protein [Sinomonas albida]|uniref:DUF1998 domain-containing protein n=1 Tax=Sinomonas albida TaxID=369942 RepID=UPI0010A8D057|nr:DUF1998 domain-containing protein [Sinomonas albida]
MAELKVRRSQLLSTYGVGGLLPDENASFMVASLDQWDQGHLTPVPEPRLARALNVAALYLPSASKKTGSVSVIRFPFIQSCSKCGRLGDLARLKSAWNDPKCGFCKSPTLTPSRLIVICQDGHIDDFPYHYWVHAEYYSPDPGAHLLELKAQGRTSSLGDMVVSCSCGRKRSLADAFFPNAFGPMRCNGRRPWLGGAKFTEKNCDKKPRATQRGASNVWFPSIASVISIPPYSEALSKAVAADAGFLADPEALTPEGRVLITTAAKKYGGKYSEEEIIAEIKRLFHNDDSGTANTAQLKKQEFAALVEGREDGPGRDFVCLPVDVDPSLYPLVTGVRRVTRLREVRALFGFSRLTAPSEDNPEVKTSPLSPEDHKVPWLPAIENIGEGIFIALDRDRLEEWSRQEFVQGRLEQLTANAKAAAAQRKQQPAPVDIIKVAVHTLAHVLIDQLSMDAGYPTSSIRERLYVDDDSAGVLLFTASADSAGSLGGLAAQADTSTLANVFREGLQRLSWCSADPVCIESTGAGTDGRNLAACHNCVYLPETSCEGFNGGLDRGLLFGTPGSRDQGLFDAFASDLSGLTPSIER